jgi:hypothetical protein
MSAKTRARAAPRDSEQQPAMEQGKRGLALTICALGFGLLAISDLTKPLSQSHDPQAGLVFFGTNEDEGDISERQVALVRVRLHFPLRRGSSCFPGGAVHARGSRLRSSALRFAFLREWSAWSASTSLATVENIGPSSEASAASQSCSPRLTVLSGIWRVPCSLAKRPAGANRAIPQR